MKKLLTIIASVALSATVAFAQNDGYKHLFIQLQGGAAETIGETSWTKLISPTAAVSLGYQFSPVFAARLNASGWQAKGAVNGPTAVYKFNYLEGGLDLMFDLCNLFGENRLDRAVNPYIFVGAGETGGFNNTDKDQYSAQFNQLISDYRWSGKELFNATLRAGLGFNFRLSNALDLNLEANSSFIEDHFNNKKGSKSDFQIQALAGLAFHFGRGPKAEPEVVPVIVPVETPAPAPAPAPKEEKIVEPEPAPAPAPAPKFEGLTENVYFIIDTWDIQPFERPKIDAIVKALNENPDTKVSISSYADKATGTYNRNQLLSKNRSAEVEKALIAAGIAADRITTAYYGDTVNPFPTPETNRVSVCVVK